MDAPEASLREVIALGDLQYSRMLAKYEAAEQRAAEWEAACKLMERLAEERLTMIGMWKDVADKLRRDGERYRYLRDHLRYGPTSQHRLEWYLPKMCSGNAKGLDAAIDEQIALTRDAAG